MNEIIQPVFKIWLTENHVVRMISSYSFPDDLDVVIRELNTNLTIYQVGTRFTRGYDYWYSLAQNFDQINGYNIEILSGSDVIYQEKFEFGNNLDFRLGKFGLDKFHFNYKDTSSWVAFWEVFVTKCYEDENVKVENGDVVVDIGANLGMFSLFAAQNAKKIYSFEPDPVTFNYLVKNTEKVDFITPINKAVYSKEGTINFIRDEFAGCSSILIEQNKHERISVEAASFGNLIKEHNIDRINFLKVDIEGAEFDLFENIDESYLENNIDKIFMEVHLNAGNQDVLLNKISKYFNYNITESGDKTFLVACKNKKL